MSTWGQRGVPQRIRHHVIARDTVCQLRYPGCTTDIDEIDHIVNVAQLGIPRHRANDLDALQGVCKACHRIKTNAEAHQGRIAWKRKPERHPGLRATPQQGEYHPAPAPQAPYVHRA